MLKSSFVLILNAFKVLLIRLKRSFNSGIDQKDV